MQQIGTRTLWLASSTHNDEERRIAKIHKRLKKKFPDILTIIAPRHPQRGPEIQKEIRELELQTALRSAGEEITRQTDIYIADTIGEMGLWYDVAKVVFIGGSLIPHGGQNFIEPSRMRDAVNRAKKADALIQVTDTQELEETIAHLLCNKDFCNAKCSLAYNWAASENKVLENIMDKVKGFI